MFDILRARILDVSLNNLRSGSPSVSIFQMCKQTTIEHITVDKGQISIS